MRKTRITGMQTKYRNTWLVYFLYDKHSALAIKNENEEKKATKNPTGHVVCVRSPEICSFFGFPVLCVAAELHKPVLVL